MRKYLLILLLIFTFSLFACGNEEEEPSNPTVETPKEEVKTEVTDEREEIYLLAVESGYKGTYEEWLASIKGDEIVLQVSNGYIQWKYTSSKIWTNLVSLAELTGSKGNDGKSVELRFFDNFIQWKYVGQPENSWKNLLNLSTLTGINGADGKTPELRVNDGYIEWRYQGDSTWKQLLQLSSLSGTDGLTPEFKATQTHLLWKYTIESDSEWKELLSLDSLKGEDGIDGVPGIDGHTPEITIGKNGNWFIDGVDSGVSAEGDKGETGEQGPTGEPGEDGNGISSIVMTSSDGLVDTYTIYYTDGSTSTFTITNGADGETPEISINSEGYWVINDTVTDVKAKGEDGKTPDIYIADNGNWIIDGEDTCISAIPFKQEFRVNNGVLQWKLENETEWKDIYNLEEYLDSLNNSMNTPEDCTYGLTFVEIVGYGYAVLNYFGYESNISIPETYKGKDVIAINTAAFEDKYIESIKISSKITTIAKNAFLDSTVYTIYYGGTAENLGWINIESGNDPLYNATVYDLNYGVVCLHKYGYFGGYDATCLESGLTDAYGCLKCNEVLYESSIIEPYGHSLTYYGSKESTCTEPGHNAYEECYRCDYTTYEELPLDATNHHLEYHSGKEATCTEPGYKEYETCYRCDYTTYEEYPALGHDMYTTDKVDATCTNDGYEYQSCSTCGHTEYKVHDRTGHSEVIDERVEPTCSSFGYTEGSHCEKCGEILVKQEQILMELHTFDGEQCINCGCEYFSQDLEYSIHEEYSRKYVSVVGNGNNEYSDIVIPGFYRGIPVTVISNDAFQNLGITSVTFNENSNIERIDYNAFKGCQFLEELYLPEGLIEIRGNAFDSCVNLKYIYLPDSLEKLEGNAFYNCQSLLSIEIPSKIEKISSWLFAECHSLNDIVINGKIVEIEEYVFNGCSSLEYFVISSSVKTMKNNIFGSCPNLTIYCELEEAPFTWALNWNEANRPVYWAGEWELDDNGNPYIVTEGLLYEFDSATDSYFVVGVKEGFNKKEVIIPNQHNSKEVTLIESFAFFGVESIETIKLSNSVKTIKENAFNNTNIETVYYLGTEEEFNSISILDGNSVLYDAKIYDLNNILICLHEYGYFGGYNPTCETSGVTDAYGCLKCDYIIQEGITIYPLGHTYESVVTNPTCDYDGYTTHTCHCGHMYTDEYINKLGHNFGEVSYVWDEGYTHLTASHVCLNDKNHVETETINTTYEVIIAPSCLTEGLVRYTSDSFYHEAFSVQSVDVVLEALGHDLTYYGFKEATCIEVGHNTYEECSRCDYSTYEEIDTLDHELTHYEYKDATCTEVGHNAYEECSRCDYTTYEEIPALGHELTYYGSEEATCTEVGHNAYEECSRCDYTTYEEIPALGHELTYYGFKEATCTEVGHNAYETCYRCDYTTYEEYPALGHDMYTTEKVEATCTNDGYEYQRCSICGITEYKVYDRTGHSEVIDEIIEPTCSSFGYTEGSHCEKCGEILVKQEQILMELHTFDGEQCINCGCEYFSQDLQYSIHEYDGELYASVDGNGNNSVSDIVIPGFYRGIPVTVISNYAFRELGITSVTFSKDSNIETIQYYAFEGCRYLEELYLPEGLKYIEGNAFGGCVNVRSVYLPDSLEKLEGNAFYNCYSLLSIEIPSKIEKIGGWLFYDCYSLNNIIIKGEIVEIGEYAFNGCYSLEYFVIPSSVSKIGSGAFNNCNDMEIFCEIEKEPFTWSVNWNEYNRPVYWAGEWHIDADGIPHAGTDGLIYNFDEITNTYILVDVQEGVELKNVLVPSKYQGKAVSAIGELAFIYENLISVVIEDGITDIETYAFYFCDKLTSISIPASVTSIGEKALHGCSSLTSIIVDENNKVYDSRNNCNAIIKTATNELIIGCGNTIIPNSVTSISYGAFYFYQNLISVNIPSSITYIENGAFIGCSNITSIIVDENNEVYDSRNNCNAIIKTATNEIIIGCQNTIILDSITSIGDKAFGYCNNLTNITIPDSVINIGDQAFVGCSSLTNIEIPDSVTSIGSTAFSGCSSLESIVLPKGISSIKSSTFSRCSSLKNITIPEGVTSIGHNAFGICNSLTSIIIPESVVDIDSDAFSGCSNLTIYCKADLKPSGWDEMWNSSNITVYWGNEWCYLNEYEVSIPHKVVKALAVEPTCTSSGLTEGEYCVLCNKVLVAQEVIPALGHDYGEVSYEWNEDYSLLIATRKCLTDDNHVETETVYTYYRVEIEPTCTTNGLARYISYSFSNAAFSVQAYDVVLEALGHELTYYDHKAATCTLAGHNEYEKCLRCDYTTYEELEALGHDEVEHRGLEATCTENGYNDYVTCTRCDYTTYEVLEALGHQLSYYDHKDATCTEAGHNAYEECSRCDYTTYEEIETLGHDLTYYKYKEATCTETGHNAYEECSRCDYSTYEEIEALGHDEVEHRGLEATCTTNGYNDYVTCSRCEYTTYEVLEALGHQLSYYDHKDATCTEAGHNAYEECGRCDYTTYEEIKTLGHDLTYYEYKEATCILTGHNAYEECSRCDYSTYEEIEAFGHKEVVDSKVEPTCEKSGLTEGSHCSVCNKIFVAQEEIEALGHDLTYYDSLDATCLESGYNDYVTCTRCDYTTYEELEALGHEEVEHEAKAATCLESGYKAYVTCTRCDYTTYEELEALGHKICIYSEELVYYTVQNDSSYPYSINGNQIVSSNHSNSSKSKFIITAQIDLTFNLEYLVSSEDTYDYLTIQHNSSQLAKASGTSNTTYTALSVVMAKGDTITITYKKDDSSSSGNDCCYVKLLTLSTETFEYEEGKIVPATPELIEFNKSCTKDVLCAVCEAVLLAAEGDHDYIYYEEKLPTCVETGHNAYTTCSRDYCDFCTEYEEYDILPHNFVDDVCTLCQVHSSAKDLKYVLSDDGNSYLVSDDANSTESNIVLSMYNNKPVTGIKASAFSGNKNLVSITIPDTLISIGDGAFYGCTNLLDVYISDLTSWCNISFDYDSDTEDGVTDYWCSSNPLTQALHLYVNGIEVTDLVIPSDVTKVNNFAFYGFKAINSVAFSQTLEEIGIGAFASTNITGNLTITNGVTIIGDEAFSNCSKLTSVSIPSTLKKIGGYAFYYCSGLTAVYITDLEAWCNIYFDYQKDYDEGWWYGCEANPLKYANDLYLNGTLVTNLVIPESVTSIGSFCFDGASITSVTFSSNLTSISHGAFRDCRNLGSVTIPRTVTYIGYYAFNGCYAMTSIRIPDSVTSIGDYAFSRTNTTIYCEASSKPSGWREDWNFMNCPVKWGVAM